VDPWRRRASGVATLRPTYRNRDPQSGSAIGIRNRGSKPGPLAGPAPGLRRYRVNPWRRRASGVATLEPPYGVCRQAEPIGPAQHFRA